MLQEPLLRPLGALWLYVPLYSPYLGSNMTPKGSQKGCQNGLIFRPIFEVLFRTPLLLTVAPKRVPKGTLKVTLF